MQHQAQQDDDVVDATFTPGDPEAVVTVPPVPLAPKEEFEPFALVKERFVLSSINTRGEKHGDERVPALDLKFKATLSNSILLKLHPALRDALYVLDRQRDIESDYGRKLRFPLLGSIPYLLEVPRVKLRVHDCDSESNDVVLIDGTANKFNITAMEGGSVAIAFRVQFSDYDTDVLAALARVLLQAVPISLSSEAADEEPETLEDQVEEATRKPRSEAWDKANQLFDQEPQTGVDDLGDVSAAGEQALADGIANAEQEEAQAESNVTPIKPTRKKRAAAGAE